MCVDACAVKYYENNCNGAILPTYICMQCKHADQSDTLKDGHVG